MVTYAVTLSDLIEKGGAYAGLAAFFGFAVLSVLAFAQAREIRRLRDWAGRAPERAQELEQRVIEQAEQARRVVATPSRRPGEPATAAAQGVVAKPIAKPAPAVAEAETTAQPAVAAEPASEDEQTATEHPVVATSAGGAPTVDAPAVSEADTDTADEEAGAVPAGAATAVTPAVPATAPANGASGDAAPKLPARATQGPPTGPVIPKRPAPAPQPLRATPPPSRRAAPAIAGSNEPSGTRRTPVIVAAVAAGLILIVIGLLAIFTGGDDKPKQAGTSTTQSPQSTAASSSATPKAGGKSKSGTAPRSQTKVAVLNGTTVGGLASQIDTSLGEAGYTEAQKPTNYTDQARSASIVFYNGSENRTAAGEIGKQLDVTDIQPIDDTASGLAPGADVVVVVGADQTP